MNLGFKFEFLHDDGFVSLLQRGVLFLQLLLLRTSPSVLIPYSDLTRVDSKLESELVLLLRLEFLLVSEMELKKTHLCLI